MSETIRQLAALVGTPVDTLVEQLAAAGMAYSDADQPVKPSDKRKLLEFLRAQHGKRSEPLPDPDKTPAKITLRRKTVTELTVAGPQGRGRTTVNVEVRQKRTYVKRTELTGQPGGELEDEREEARRKLEESRAQNAAEVAALAEADRRRREEETRRKEEEEGRRKAEEQAALAAAEEAARAVAPEADATKRKAADQAPARKDGPAKTPEKAREEPRRHKPGRGSHRMAETDVSEDVKAPPYIRGELHLSNERRVAPGKKRMKARPAEFGRSGGDRHGFSRPTAPMVREIEVGESITVGDLAQKLAVKAGELIKALMKMGVMATINQVLDHDTAVLVVEELGHRARRAEERDVEMELIAHSELQGDQATRPPVVTIMGHVDHGKTSLLDHIRRAKVAAGEAGGITQHIGAYHVETPKGVITFLDTPGHAAFTSMRARGARLTDIVILVVAGDDGVMPQTVEAVQHARAAGTPLIVAVNKMDKPDSNADQVKQELLQHEVVAEEFGGEVAFVPVSAKTGMGIDDLLDAILVQAEVMELSAVPEGAASGIVIESRLDKGRGAVATVLVQQGLLEKGDYVVCGVEYGRVRAMFDENGKPAQSAGPSIPVEILGLSGSPDAGDELVAVANERMAKEVAQTRQAKRREARLAKSQMAKLEDIVAQMGQTSEQQTLNILIKADVQGSVEALRESLTQLTNERVRVNVIGAGVGGITESDATLAAASKALVIGFNVRTDASARKVVGDAGIDVRYFSIIYDVIDQVKQAVTGLLGTEIREDILGIAEVRDVFRSSKFGQIAGCMVVEGTVKRSKPIRVLRDNVVVFEGELESLRRFKEAVEEVRNGTECGIGVKGYDVKVGDQIECFERVEVKRTL
ncbi:MAG: translation initiation factor IF-2 [Xanthomonadales bacterium]|nr:translation initiation factor IF-2 [Xanthomonadales bacterium]